MKYFKRHKAFSEGKKSLYYSGTSDGLVNWHFEERGHSLALWHLPTYML
jgi:hypothetical protein